MTPQQFQRLKDCEQQIDALISLVRELAREVDELKARPKPGRPRKQDDERQSETPS